MTRHAILLMLTSAILTLATATAPHGGHPRWVYERQARQYFDVWNMHDASRLRQLFADGATLRDWDIQASGADAVVSANHKIFAAFPKISIEVESIHVSEHTHTAVCEILVHLHNVKAEVLKVVDVITFEPAGRISSVRAYKG